MKKEAWRLSSLKRHAETNKLEQALKVSQTNEGLLKKKADMLELTVMSHQKSMDKGRANIVRDQLKADELAGVLAKEDQVRTTACTSPPRRPSGGPPCCASRGRCGFRAA